MIADRYRPLKALQLPQIFAMARKAVTKTPSDLEMLMHCWGEAALRHADLGKMMQLRAVLEQVTLPKPERFKTAGIEPADWFLDVFEAARSLSKGRAKAGIYRVYVLLLRGYPGGEEGAPALYVGETHVTPAARLAQHLEGTNAARAAQRFAVAALPSFSTHLVKLSREDSTRLEAELAERLRVVLGRFRLSANRVQGGH